MPADVTPSPQGGGGRSYVIGMLAMVAMAGQWIALILAVIVIGTLAFQFHSVVIELTGLIVVNVAGRMMKAPLVRMGLWGRRHRARAYLAAGSAAPTVLYLRSFAVDDLTGRTVERSSIWWTDEEQVKRAFAPIGAMVATGRPGDWLPPAGAVRAYLHDDHWKQQVTDLVSEAELVLLAAGTSRGLLWEIDLVVARLSPQRLVVLLPFGADGYLPFHRAAAPRFPKSLPEQFNGAPKSAHSFKGAIYFDADWTPHLVSFGGDKRDSLDVICLRELAPVFQHCGDADAGNRLIRKRESAQLKRIAYMFTLVLVIAGCSVLVLLSR